MHYLRVGRRASPNDSTALRAADMSYWYFISARAAFSHAGTLLPRQRLAFCFFLLCMGFSQLPAKRRAFRGAPRNLCCGSALT